MTVTDPNKYQLTDDQLAFLVGVRRFCRERIEPRAAEIDSTAEFPTDLFRQMGELSYMGAPYAEEWGGAGCDAVMVCLLLEEVSRASGAVGSSLNAHISLASSVIANHGTEEQKRKYLMQLTSGRKIGAFGLTEPSGGSNAGACRTRAVNKGGRWVLTGSKQFITNSPVADIFVVTARTAEGSGSKGVSAFILERRMKGNHERVPRVVSRVGPPEVLSQVRRNGLTPELSVALVDLPCSRLWQRCSNDRRRPQNTDCRKKAKDANPDCQVHFLRHLRFESGYT